MLNKAERQMVKEAKLRQKAGDRAGSDALLGRLLALSPPKRKRKPSELTYLVEQRALPIFVEAPEVGPLHECHLVACRLGGTVPAVTCVKKQRSPVASGRQAHLGTLAHPECKACEIGKGYAARYAGRAPTPLKNYDISRDNQQRAARQKLIRSGALDDVPTLDSALAEEG